MNSRQNRIGLFNVKPSHFRSFRFVACLSVFLLFLGCFAGCSHVAYAARGAFTLRTTAQTETTVTLSWDQSSDAWFYSYTLWFSASVNGPYTNIWTTGNKAQTTYAVSGLTSNTNYYFYIADAGLLVNYNSNTLQVATVLNPTLAKTSFDYSSATLTWTDYNTQPYSSLEPFVSYTLQTSNSASGPWSTVTSITDSSQSSYRQMGLFHQTYWFRMYDTVGPSGTEVSYSNTVSVAIPVAPTITISASANALDAGQQDQFTSSTSGGLPPYSNYRWYSNGTLISGATTSSYTWNPKTSGTYYIKASVQDTLGIPVDSNQILVTVNSLPLISISAPTTLLTVGDKDQFSSSTSGGVPPYSYRWYSNGDPIEGATSASLTFTPTDAGTFNIYATVQDYYNGTASSNSIQVTVKALLAVNVSTSTSAVNVGQNVQLSASATGGASPYTYQWYENGNPIDGATSSNYIFTPNSAGTYSLYAATKDAVNATVNSNTVQITVTSSSTTFSLPAPLMIIVIVAGVVVIIVVAALLLLFRKRGHNKTQKTQSSGSDDQHKI